MFPLHVYYNTKLFNTRSSSFGTKQGAHDVAASYQIPTQQIAHPSAGPCRDMVSTGEAGSKGLPVASLTSEPSASVNPTSHTLGIIKGILEAC